MNEIEIGKCLAFDVKGNVFPKDVIIYQIKDKSWILSFGGFCQYSISSLIKKGFPIKHKTNRIVIDMMGRNHRNFETFIHLNVVNSLLSKAFEILFMFWFTRIKTIIINKKKQLKEYIVKRFKEIIEFEESDDKYYRNIRNNNFLLSIFVEMILLYFKPKSIKEIDDLIGEISKYEKS